MSLYAFVKSMEDFFHGRIDRKNILNHLKSFEDEFLAMEKENKYMDKHEKDIMEQAMDVLNNIYILLDDFETIPDSELKKQICDLTELQLSIGNKITSSEEQEINRLKNNFEHSYEKPGEKKSVLPAVFSSYGGSNIINFQFQTKPLGQLMPSGGNFNFHPAINFKKPPPEHYEDRKSDLQSSPLQGLLTVAKQYASLGTSLIEFSKVLENSFNEINSIKQNSIASEFEGNEKRFNGVLEEMLSKISGISNIITGREDDKDIKKYIVELEDLNGKFIELKKTIPRETDSTEEKSLAPETDDFMENIASFMTDNSTEEKSPAPETDDFMKNIASFMTDNSTEEKSPAPETDDFMENIASFMTDNSTEEKSPPFETDDFMENIASFAPDDSAVSDKEVIKEDVVSPLIELDMVEELIKNVIKSTSKEDFITENYITVKKTALMFLKDRIDSEEFKKILMEMKNTVIKARKEHEEAYLLESEWTVEVAAGDRLLMEGMNGYEKGLTLLEDNLYEKNEDKIKASIDMIYEANKKLVLNQCLVKYIEDILSQRNKISPLKNFLKI
jgi:hypothetical protein